MAPSTWNVAFTWTGLKALGIEANTLASFPEDFRDGMAARAVRLGDVGKSAPAHWEGWLGSREVHGVLVVSLQAPPQGDDLASRLAIGLFELPTPGALPRTPIADLLDKLPSSGMRILHTELGKRIPSPSNPDHRIEHFGFRDGVSQPFAGVDIGARRPPPPGGGTPRPGGTWDPIAPGELLLGHPDEDGLFQARPANEELRQDGTYMVFRKLEQDVVAFRRYLGEHGGQMGRESVLAAQMMGRWPDGTSLVKSTDWPTDRGDDRTVNDFRYESEDPRGLRCPLGSHARRVNPRDSNDRDEARRHRIWRRSITYGDFLPYESAGDGKSRGLLFVAMCARIDQQFEFLQTRWLNTGEFIGQAGIGRCPVTGANGGDIEDTFVASGRVAPYTKLPRFVKVLGGDYFFMPSLPALEKIVNGEKFPSPAVEPKNPSLDQTPKLDVEALVQLGKKMLLPVGSPAWLQPDPRLPLVVVGRQITSSGPDFVRDVLSRFDLAPRFEFVLTCDDIELGKPHPEIYLLAARRFGVEPAQLLVLEDSANGCRAAVAAGAIAVAVPAGTSLRHDFSGAALVAQVAGRSALVRAAGASSRLAAGAEFAHGLRRGVFGRLALGGDFMLHCRHGL